METNIRSCHLNQGCLHFLEIYHRFAFHFNTSLAHVILLIRSSVRSLAVDSSVWFVRVGLKTYSTVDLQEQGWETVT